MLGHAPLSADRLRRTVDPGSLGFTSTSELEPGSGLIGQDRALRAIEFGIGIRQLDFNLFVLGNPSSGKTTAVKAYLKRRAASEPPPSDWIYVNKIDDPNRPKAISLPPGRAPDLAKTMIAIIEDLRSAVPSAFESEDYQVRRRAIEEEFRSIHETAFAALSETANAQGIAVLRTPTGIAMAPLDDGKIVKPEAFEALDPAARREIEGKIEALQHQLEEVLQEVPRLQKSMRERLQALNEELAEIVIGEALREPAERFADCPDVLAHLQSTRRDLIHNVAIFLMPDSQASGEGDGEAAAAPAIVGQLIDITRDGRYRRYLVNVLVSNGSSDRGSSEYHGAPIVEELNPTLGNLIGRVEHIARLGTLMTDFLLIKPGALHRANGGYLLIDARKLLTSPLSWEALKRVLKGHEIRIESPMDTISLITTQSLDAAPIPLSVKVVLFGDRQLYYTLSALDPDFQRLFKVQADFDDTAARSLENLRDYGRLVAAIVQRHALKAVDATGVAALIEQASRIADDNQKLSLAVGQIADLLREADYWAGVAGHTSIGAGDIRQAIEEAIQRADRVRDQAQDSIIRDIMLVDTDGEKIGQINALSVLALGNFAFGRPSRITASVSLGNGRVTDIERESELGGALHSKGVMILWGFLSGRYATEMPLSLSASLVFEQSYGGVDGDSASSTELYALLSALANVPIGQSFAVTGSVNQRGEVQAIGGVNEKVEGFFDICKRRGLTGRQGVLIPKANEQHLMLREDVVAAAREGKFAIYAVETIDQGIEILTGRPAGTRGADGAFPDGSINRLVEDRLRAFALARKAFGDKSGGAIS